MGLAFLRMPPELRRGHRADDQQENEGMGAGTAVPRCASLTKDVTSITDAARGKNFSNFMMALALLKNYKPFQAPPSLRLKDLWMKFDKTWALSKNADKKYGKTNPTARMKTP